MVDYFLKLTWFIFLTMAAELSCKEERRRRKKEGSGYGEEWR